VIEFPKLSTELINHFIRGYFDGDGSIIATNKTLTFTICSGSENFLQSILDILNFITLKKYKIYKRINQNLYVLIINNYDDIIKIKNYLFDKSSIYLDRKKEKFDYINCNKEKIISDINLYYRERWKKRNPAVIT
jgi:hypothetical protein